jgi:hypothetical protein
MIYIDFSIKSRKIKVFSNYVEESDGQVINDLPNYAFFKKSTQEYVWRDSEQG